MTDDAPHDLTHRAMEFVRSNRRLVLEATSVMRKISHGRSPETPPANASEPADPPASSLVTLTSSALTQHLPDYMLEKIKEKHARTTLSVADDRAKFFQAWNQVILEFVQDPREDTFDCPSELSAFDRKEIHRLAQRYNLGHHSTGIYPDRHLVLTKDKFFFQEKSAEKGAQRIDDLVRKPEKSLHRDRRPLLPYEAFDEEAARRMLVDSSQGRSVEARGVLSRLAAFQKKANPHANAVQCATVASSSVLSVEDARPEEPADAWEDKQSSTTTSTSVATVGTKWSRVLDPHLEHMEKAAIDGEANSMYPYHFGPEMTANGETSEVSGEQPTDKALPPADTIQEGCGRKRQRAGKK